MKIRVEVVCSDADCNEQRCEVLTIERQELVMETLGLNLSDDKALLAGVQDFVIAQQAQEYLEQQRTCPACGRRHTSKDSGSTPLKTIFGLIHVANPRWNRCPCPGR